MGTTETTEPNTESFDIPIDLGNKVVTFRKWKGKERRSIQNKVKNSSITNFELQDILIYNCMSEKIFLTKDEILYVLLYLYYINIHTHIHTYTTCKHCSIEYSNDISIESILQQAVKNTISDINIKDYSFSFRECLKEDFIINYKKVNIEDTGLFYFCSLVETLNSETVDYNVVLNFLEKLPIKEYDLILATFYSSLFYFVPIETSECPECKGTNYTLVDAVPALYSKFIV